MQAVYFKTDTSGPFRVSCTQDGRIDFSLLGRRFGFDPLAIELNGISFPLAELKSLSNWEEIKDFFYKDDGIHCGTKDNPVVVTGEAPVRAVSTALISLIEPAARTEGETSAKRQRIHSSFDKIQMDFESEDCDISKWKSGTLVSTAGMKKVMESFGEFPAEYYVRQEEIYVFEAIWSRWGKNYSAVAKLEKFAIVGSPGVGKSAFIVFLAFYMARLKSRTVLLFRRIKKVGALAHTCVVLSQDYYYEIKGNKFDDFEVPIVALHNEIPGLLYFVDGFSQNEVNKNSFLGGYLMLATSSQFRRKSDDPTKLAVLPAWQFGDLKDFALKTKLFEGGVDAEDRTRYYYSGGSLREFCRDSTELLERVEDSINAVGVTSQAVTLMGEHGGASEIQLDGLRRRYLNDPKDKEQYKQAASKFVVDSGYVLRRLLRQCDKEQYEKVYNFTKAFGDAFHGWAFEAYLHKLAISGGFTIQAKMNRSADPRAKKNPSADPRVQYEIKCSEPTSEGKSESECMTSLLRWASNGKSKYWYPGYPRFPNIHSVVKAVHKPTGKTVIAYIQITVGETHSLNGTWMDSLDVEVSKVFSGLRIYIAIQPQNVGSDQKLKITGPLPKRVDLYEAYFEGCLYD